jgi:hypothetical protein
VYATIRHYAGNPHFAAQLAARRADVLDVIGAVPGVRAYYLIRTADGTTSVTVCEDADGAEESNRAAAAWIRENMPDAAGSPPRVTAGEILISL